MEPDKISVCEFVTDGLNTSKKRDISGEEGKLASHISSSYFFPSFLPYYLIWFMICFEEGKGKTNLHGEAR